MLNWIIKLIAARITGAILIAAYEKYGAKYARAYVQKSNNHYDDIALNNFEQLLRDIANDYDDQKRAGVK